MERQPVVLVLIVAVAVAVAVSTGVLVRASITGPDHVDEWAGGVWPSAAATSSPEVTALLVVDDASAGTAGDTVLGNHLRTGLGYEVVAVSDEAAPPLGGVDVVVVAESVNSTTLGTKYRDVGLPVLVAENGAWANMRMATGNTTLTGQTQVKVTAAAHATAGGLGAGNHTVVSSSIDLKHPTTIPSTATKVATVATDTNRPVLWAIDKGAALTSGTAPARRVGLGLNDGAYSRLAPAGFDLFDAAMRWLLDESVPRDATAMLLFGDGASHLNLSELAVRSRLRAKGLNVTVVRDSELTGAGQADGFDLVVMSKTVLSTTIGNKLKATTTPVLFWEDNQQQTSMLATVDNTNVSGTGWHSAGTQLTIHPGTDASLRAGLSGVTSFLTTSGEITYAPKASNGAQTLGTGVTRIADHGTGLTAIYVYDTGTKLADNTTAMGRRAYIGLYDDTYRLLTTNGIALFDALLDWTLNPTS